MGRTSRIQPHFSLWEYYTLLAPPQCQTVQLYDDTMETDMSYQFIEKGYANCETKNERLHWNEYE